MGICNDTEIVQILHYGDVYVARGYTSEDSFPAAVMIRIVSSVRISDSEGQILEITSSIISAGMEKK